MLKEISVGLAVVGIIMAIFREKYPKVAGWGVIIALLGFLGIYFFS